MSNKAFTAGVKPGGLTTSTEIRILLCYLLARVGTPLSRAQIEASLVGQELVNYFELADALGDLCEKGHLRCDEDDRYTVTDSGKALADTLESDLPRTVRESAVNAVIAAQTYARKKAQYHAHYDASPNGYLVHCSIEDLGETVFSVNLYMPDELSAKAAQDKFILHGDKVFAGMLTMLVDNA